MTTYKNISCNYIFSTYVFFRTVNGLHTYIWHSTFSFHSLQFSTPSFLFPPLFPFLQESLPMSLLISACLWKIPWRSVVVVRSGLLIHPCPRMCKKRSSFSTNTSISRIVKRSTLSFTKWNIPTYIKATFAKDSMSNCQDPCQSKAVIVALALWVSICSQISIKQAPLWMDKPPVRTVEGSPGTDIFSNHRQLSSTCCCVPSAYSRSKFMRCWLPPHALYHGST